MDGVLTVRGFKFREDLYLNLQNKTIITGDSYTVHELFNMLEKYFTRKNFSEHYLQAGVSFVLEGRALPIGEYLVFRIKPFVDLSEELKIGKRTLLGQILENIFNKQEKSLNNLLQTMNEDILPQINLLTQKYSVQFAFECEDIFSLAKILRVQTLTQNDEIFFNEHDQFQVKTMLLNMISRLEVDKKKLLLMELPEYGLKAEEIEILFAQLKQINVENLLIFTQDSRINNYFSDIFNYHLAIENNLLGFEDYEDLEKTLLTMFDGLTKEKLSQNVIKCIFPSIPLQPDDKISYHVKEFLHK